MKQLLKKIIPSFLLSFYHYCLAFLGAFFYGFPSKELTIIGITGTSGKTTVAELTLRIFKEAGLKTALISSITSKMLKMTMPGRFKIQKFLKQAIKRGSKYVILEVTSEGIKQYRHKFIDFDAVVLTNLSPEHIESHGSFENYRKAKLRLFEENRKIHIINSDDKNADYFLKIPAKQKITFGMKDKNLISESFKLLGEFNLYNAIAAAKIALSQGISLDVCQKALAKVNKIEGRLEIISQNPLIVVDYAHTPKALEEAYKTIKELSSTSSLICVLGSCGGGRDKWKRPVMGKIAQQYCQEVIITNEDPYDEDPMEIINQVAGSTAAKKMLNRKEAIKKAVFLAGPEDAVIITGKGSEPWMCVKGGKKISWDDRQITREALAEKRSIY